MRPGADLTIVEDHLVLAQSLAIVLQRAELSVRVLDVTGLTANRILDEIRATRPRVALLDLDLGGGTDGAELIPALVHEGIPTVVLTGSSDPIRHGRCLADGALRVVRKSTSIDEIAQLVHAVLLGRCTVDPRRSADLVRQWHAHRARQREATERFDRLTVRERQVLHGLMSGLRPTDIAVCAGVSKHTVRSQVKSILTKLGVASQLEAVAEARRVGWPSR